VLQEVDSTPLLDLFTVARWLGFFGVIGLTGAATFQALVRHRLAPSHPADAPRLIARARTAALLALLLLIIAGTLKLNGQVHSLLDPGDKISWDTVKLVLFESTWGHSWIVQAGVAVGGAALLLLVGRGWVLPLLALAALFTGPLTGHARDNPWGQMIGVLLHGVHQLGGGVWLGTLFMIVILGYGGTRGMPLEERHLLIARLVHAYSPLALTGMGTAVVAGLLLGYGYIGSISTLVSTAYGLTLLVKVAFLAGTAGIGAYNWRRVRPSLGEAVASDRLFRSATLELILGALLLAATAVLVALPAPRLE
jgi:putative copper export protein